MLLQKAYICPISHAVFNQRQVTFRRFLSSAACPSHSVLWWLESLSSPSSVDSETIFLSVFLLSTTCETIQYVFGEWGIGWIWTLFLVPGFGSVCTSAAPVAFGWSSGLKRKKRNMWRRESYSQAQKIQVITMVWPSPLIFESNSRQKNGKKRSPLCRTCELWLSLLWALANSANSHGHIRKQTHSITPSE